MWSRLVGDSKGMNEHDVYICNTLYMCPQCCVLLRCDSQHPQEVVAAMQAHLRRQIQWTLLPRRLNHLKTADLYLLIINKAAGVSSPGTARYVGLNSRISAALHRLNLEECQIHFRADFSNHSVYLQLNHLLFSRAFVIAVTSVNVFFWLSFRFWQDVFYFCSSSHIPRAGSTCTCVCQTWCCRGQPES